MFKCDIRALDILGHGLLWIVIIILTLGLGLFFFPYSFSKFILNRTTLEVGGVTRGVRCELDAASQLGHIVLWVLLTIVTLGLAYPFYVYKVWGLAISRSRLIG